MATGIERGAISEGFVKQAKGIQRQVDCAADWRFGELGEFGEFGEFGEQGEQEREGGRNGSVGKGIWSSCSVQNRVVLHPIYTQRQARKINRSIRHRRKLTCQAHTWNLRQMSAMSATSAVVPGSIEARAPRCLTSAVKY